MKKITSFVAAITMLSCVSFAFAGTINGPVKQATKNADDSYTIVVKDIKSKNDVTIEVMDQETKEKLSSKKIWTGDEVEVKFTEKDGKNINTTIMKEGGC